MTDSSLSTFQFLSFRVLALEFKTNVDAVPNEEYRYDIQLQRHVLKAQAVHDRPHIPINLEVRVRLLPAPGPFEVRILVQGTFSYDNQTKEEDAERLCLYHAPALLYTQLRPLLRMVASEAGFPNFTLPLLNVTHALRAYDEAQSDATASKTAETD